MQKERARQFFSREGGLVSMRRTWVMVISIGLFFFEKIVALFVQMASARRATSCNIRLFYTNTEVRILS